MLKYILLILVFNFSWNIQSQDVNYDNVIAISSILCECLNSNKLKPDNIRINECTSVLSEGLSVIKDESLKEKYAQKSDTYLQRNCIEYAKLIYHNVPVSNISLVNKSDFEISREVSKDDLQSLIGNYSYKDFIGDAFEVKITKSYWIEEISSSGNYVKFLIDLQNQSLIYLESNDPFFQDYYRKDEMIKIKFSRLNNNGLDVILNLGNDLYLRKVLESI